MVKGSLSHPRQGDEPPALPEGVCWLPGHLDPAAQASLLADVEVVLAAAPPFQPVMPRTGRPFSVRMTNCGPLGWVSDRAGYRYQATHPVTGQPWPPMPATLRSLWSALSGCAQPAEACLVNLYDGSAKMGLHQDRDEEDFSAPVVSVSLGDACRFRIGGWVRSDPTVSLRLDSGDVVVMGGPARLAFHGVDGVYPGTSGLIAGGGRINLTLRRVTLPA